MSFRSRWMEAAFDEAKTALQKGEVPVGCVVVYNDNIIATGRNTVNETKNATRHAEINALDSFLSWSKANNGWASYQKILKQCTLYVTVEPCIMCAEAVGHFGIGELVFGCNNDRFGGCGSVSNILALYDHVKIIRGIKEEEAINLLKVFYKGDNPNSDKRKSS